MKKVLILIFAFIFLAFSCAEAAVVSPSTSGNITFNMTPKNPGSFANVTIKANSLETDMDNSYFSWYLNGGLEKEGMGSSEFSFTTDKAGKKTFIKMTAKTATELIEKTMEINPADIEIFYEANNYVPPFYKGKALPTAKSNVKLIAIPKLVSENGTTLAPSELTYTWSNKMNIIDSGTGKDFTNVTIGSPYTTNYYSVKAENANGDIVAENNITISPSSPFILFYEEKPLEGTKYENAFKRTSEISGNEISIRAEPFFFSLPEFSSDKNLLFSWTMNGKGAAPNDGTPKIITLRNESGESITSSIGLNIKSLSNVFESANNSIIIKSTPEASF